MNLPIETENRKFNVKKDEDDEDGHMKDNHYKCITYNLQSQTLTMHGLH